NPAMAFAGHHMYQSPVGIPYPPPNPMQYYQGPARHMGAMFHTYNPPRQMFGGMPGFGVQPGIYNMQTTDMQMPSDISTRGNEPYTQPANNNNNNNFVRQINERDFVRPGESTTSLQPIVSAAHPSEISTGMSNQRLVSNQVIPNTQQYSQQATSNAVHPREFSTHDQHVISSQTNLNTVHLKNTNIPDHSVISGPTLPDGQQPGEHANMNAVQQRKIGKPDQQPPISNKSQPDGQQRRQQANLNTVHLRDVDTPDQSFISRQALPDVQQHRELATLNTVHPMGIDTPGTTTEDPVLIPDSPKNNTTESTSEQQCFLCVPSLEPKPPESKILDSSLMVTRM
ncbi:MAG: hypothetical protein ABW185_19820, partial [Sedimenticola sp.]